MASIQPVSSSAYVPPVKPQAPAQPQAPRAEEVREPAREARAEARSRSEEPGQAAPGVGSRLDVTA